MTPHVNAGSAARTATRNGANARFARWLAVFAVLAFGFGFALVPLYDVFCRVTGIGGRPVDARTTGKRGGIDKSRLVTVEMMATRMPGASAILEPKQGSVVVHPGDIVTATYRLRNPTGSAIVGQAVPSISPGTAASHLHKLECFCFQQQTLEPGADRELPVVFYVSRELPARDTAITLSYAFYPVMQGGKDN